MTKYWLLCGDEQCLLKEGKEDLCKAMCKYCHEEARSCLCGRAAAVELGKKALHEERAGTKLGKALAEHRTELQQQQQAMAQTRQGTRMCQEGVCQECWPTANANEPSKWRTLPMPMFAKKGHEVSAKANRPPSGALRDSSVARCSGLMPFCLANRCRCRRTTSAPSTASTLGPQSEGAAAIIDEACGKRVPLTPPGSPTNSQKARSTYATRKKRKSSKQPEDKRKKRKSSRQA